MSLPDQDSIKKGCHALRHHLAIVERVGDMKPCCIVRPNDDSSGAPLWPPLYTTEPQSFQLNSTERQRLTNQFEKGEFPSECIVCRRSEEQTGLSVRKWYNSQFEMNESQSLIRLELALDFSCNMSCWICGPHCSSRWLGKTKLLKDLHQVSSQTTGIYGPINESNLQQAKDFPERLLNLLESLDLQGLKEVRIVGGEPFFSPHLKKMLELLIENANPGDIKICFNTNASIFPSDPIQSLLGQFKELQIDFSIDAVGPLQSLIRPPTSFDHIETVVKKWRGHKSPRLNMAIHSTLSILNVNAMGDLLRWGESVDLPFDFTLLHGPDFFSYHQLPSEVLQKMYEKDADIIDRYSRSNFFVNNAPIPAQKDILLGVLDTHSTHQGESFSEINPEMFEVINKYL